MTDFQERTWLEVSLDNLEFNLKSIRDAVSQSTMIMGVVKANAYGHGDKYISLELENQGLVNWFGVSRLEEALALRDYGIKLPILVFGVTPVSYANTMVEYNITPTIHNFEYAKELDTELKKLSKKINVHIKLDTGMARLGMIVTEDFVDATISEIAEIKRLDNIGMQGIYTHFAVSDEGSDESVEFTKLQFSRYQIANERLGKIGISFDICHVSNSAAIMCYPEMNLDMVRAGIIIYGLEPSADCINTIPLKPVMNWLGKIVSIKKAIVGSTVSYGRTFTAERETLVANIGIGYADGFSRAFSNSLSLIVNGKRASIIGRVCMDQLMIDVTDIPNVKAGDIVTVVGKDGEEEITFAQLATETNTIHYEKTSGITPRVPRVYIRNGKVVAVTDLLRGRSCGFDKQSIELIE